MPRRVTSRTRIAAAAVPVPRIFDDARMPEALRTTLRGAEALSVGLVHALTDTVVTAVRGVQEVGAALGTTALSAVRGSIRAAEEIGGDLGRLAMNATSGAARMVGFSARRPLRKVERPRRRRTRRAAA
jgi:hypothetical protein